MADAANTASSTAKLGRLYFRKQEGFPTRESDITRSSFVTGLSYFQQIPSRDDNAKSQPRYEKLDLLEALPEDRVGFVGYSPITPDAPHTRDRIFCDKVRDTLFALGGLVDAKSQNLEMGKQNTVNRPVDPKHISGIALACKRQKMPMVFLPNKSLHAYMSTIVSTVNMHVIGESFLDFCFVIGAGYSPVILANIDDKQSIEPLNTYNWSNDFTSKAFIAISSYDFASLDELLNKNCVPQGESTHHLLPAEAIMQMGRFYASKGWTPSQKRPAFHDVGANQALKEMIEEKKPQTDDDWNQLFTDFYADKQYLLDLVIPSIQQEQSKSWMMPLLGGTAAGLLSGLMLGYYGGAVATALGFAGLGVLTAAGLAGVVIGVCVALLVTLLVKSALDYYSSTQENAFSALNDVANKGSQRFKKADDLQPQEEPSHEAQQPLLKSNLERLNKVGGKLYVARFAFKYPPNELDRETRLLPDMKLRHRFGVSTNGRPWRRTYGYQNACRVVLLIEKLVNFYKKNVESIGGESLAALSPNDRDTLLYQIKSFSAEDLFQLQMVAFCYSLGATCDDKQITEGFCRQSSKEAQALFNNSLMLQPFVEGRPLINYQMIAGLHDSINNSKRDFPSLLLKQAVILNEFSRPDVVGSSVLFNRFYQSWLGQSVKQPMQRMMTEVAGLIIRQCGNTRDDSPTELDLSEERFFIQGRSCLEIMSGQINELECWKEISQPSREDLTAGSARTP